MSIAPLEKQQTFTLQTGKELRIFANGDNSSFVVTRGEAEWNGTQIELNKQYPLAKNAWITLYSLQPTEIQVLGDTNAYEGKKTVIDTYYQTHLEFNKAREEAKKVDDKAPVILVTGPIRSGKGTLSLHLLNYAVRDGYAPLFVDLDLSSNLLTMPGCIGASVVTSCYDPSSQYDFNFNQPLVYCCGSTSVKDIKTYLYFVGVLAEQTKKKMNSNGKVKEGGIIIRCPFISMEIIREVIQKFGVNFICSLDSEELYSELSRQFQELTVLQLDKPSGLPLCVNYDEFVKKHQQQLVRNYFEGCNRDRALIYREKAIQINEFKLVKVETHDDKALMSATTTGISSTITVEEVDFTQTSFSMLQNDIVAMINAKSTNSEDILSENANVLGFVHITKIEAGNNEPPSIVLEVPNNMDLPSYVFMKTGIKKVIGV